MPLSVTRIVADFAKDTMRTQLELFKKVLDNNYRYCYNRKEKGTPLKHSFFFMIYFTSNVLQSVSVEVLAFIVEVM